MKSIKHLATVAFVSLCSFGLVACEGASLQSAADADQSTPASASPDNSSSNNQRSQASPNPAASQPLDRSCTSIDQGFGAPGTVNVRAEEVVNGLEVPWGIAFLPNNEMLVTERPGQVRLVRNGQLESNPVATLPVSDRGEGGLLGIATHPDFATNRLFYLYYTAQGGTPANRVERWRLAEDRRSAVRDRVILDNIPVAVVHNGGRIRFGPDGMLYIATGDSREPQESQDVNSLAGKILRVTPDGQVPPDNPFPNNPAFITGVRNSQGFDWANPSTLWVADHGPSGELGRSGRDEINVARAGDNLGWPTIYGCQTQEGLVAPALTWNSAVPPGGAAVYTGDAIPEWKGSLIVGTLGSRHLHRVAFDPNNPGQVQRNEVYLRGEWGRLREVVMSPDGELYVTTSNCDGRGDCPADQDKILRITR
ncbi:PQQ-dependent sugar dehydrogenase [Myxacorys almedinensis]|uniref:PQQ-dependent sugar dehydrogenase n=1 Tax=Myxacorys almedinensis A TaxID=2690445 RepID=A0A8J7Z3X2_9CYAN|nr:PQQ-dependent sugar dehydrogenase [Myxacorys almedinensis]NDJ19284.1 PQQ-dependent sugar dehydrogenase [Myxacorys almedinensis A]